MGDGMLQNTVMNEKVFYILSLWEKNLEGAGDLGY